MNEERTSAAGFLAHLVERVRPTEPLLQRRQPSLFEPVQPWTDARTRDGTGDGIDSAARTLADAPESPAAAAQAAPIAVFAPARLAVPTPPSRQGAEGVDKPQPAAMQAAATTIRQELRMLRETLRIDPSLRMIHEGTAPTSAAAVPIAAPMALMAPAALGAPEAPRASTTSSATEKPRATQAAPEPSVRTATRLPAAATAVTPLPRRPVHPEAMPAPTTPRPRTVPPLPPHSLHRVAALQAAMRQTPAPAARELPPVQVTIGRVDVRAVAAPPAAERSQRSTPRLSLEQYLRERHGDRS